jgi:hypothetical protein
MPPPSVEDTRHQKMRHVSFSACAGAPASAINSLAAFLPIGRHCASADLDPIEQCAYRPHAPHAEGHAVAHAYSNCGKQREEGHAAIRAADHAITRQIGLFCETISEVCGPIPAVVGGRIVGAADANLSEVGPPHVLVMFRAVFPPLEGDAGVRTPPKDILS